MESYLYVIVVSVGCTVSVLLVYAGISRVYSLERVTTLLLSVVVPSIRDDSTVQLAISVAENPIFIPTLTKPELASTL